MDKIIKKSFDILIKNSAIMQPLIIFILFIMLLAKFLGSNIVATPCIILFYLLFSAFLAGWFNIIKYAADNYKYFDKNDVNYPVDVANYNIETMKRFFSGVGEYYVPMLCCMAICIFIIIGVLYSAQYFFPINQQALLNAYSEPAAFIAFMKANLKVISLNLLYVFAVIFLLRFLLLFWFPIIYYKVKNPFKTFFSSIGFLFKNFVYSVGVFSFILACTIILSVIGLFLTPFYILSLIFLIIQIYFLAFIWIFIFCAYKGKLIQEEIEKMNAKDVFIKSVKTEEQENADEK